LYGGGGDEICAGQLLFEGGRDLKLGKLVHLVLRYGAGGRVHPRSPTGIRMTVGVDGSPARFYCGEMNFSYVGSF
jgi:hypothetical protein